MKYKIIIGILLFYLISYFVYFFVFNKRRKLSRIVKGDLEKYKYIKETDSRLYPFLINAWKSVGYDVNESNISSYDNEEPWSAAAISYWMRKTGIDNFPSSANHSHYVLAAKVKRETGVGVTKLRLFRLNEFKPRVGDLICYSRGSDKTNYDSIYDGAKTHCDIAIEVFNDKVIAVGGNVSNQIKATNYYTTNGFISEVKNNKPFIGVIKNGHF